MNDDRLPPDDALDAEIRELETKLDDAERSPLDPPKTRLDALEEEANSLLSSASERKVNLPDPPDFDKLDEIHQRGTAGQQALQSEREIPEGQRAYMKATSVGMAAAYGFLAVPAGFFLIGLMLQNTVWPGPNAVKVMTLVGVVSGFAYMLVVLSRGNKD
ncbi:MAG: hypothetical protein JNJ45_02995 [Chthonomonas sp.]|nr:hypothetical protein [Chthonomonas sp.]